MAELAATLPKWVASTRICVRPTTRPSHFCMDGAVVRHPDRRHGSCIDHLRRYFLDLTACTRRTGSSRRRTRYPDAHQLPRRKNRRTYAKRAHGDENCRHRALVVAGFALSGRHGTMPTAAERDWSLTSFGQPWCQCCSPTEDGRRQISSRGSEGARENLPEGYCSECSAWWCCTSV